MLEKVLVERFAKEDTLPRGAAKRRPAAAKRKLYASIACTYPGLDFIDGWHLAALASRFI